MSERTSKLILIAEALLLALPVSALAVYISAGVVSYALKSQAFQAQS